jgi:DNA polymerase-1
MANFFIKQLVRENPEYLIFITDAPGKNFRNDLFEDYKATRDRMPDDLKSQMQPIHDMIRAM